MREPMPKNLIPDPLNDSYATDPEGRLYVHTIIEHNGRSIDIGYSLAERD